MKHLEDVDSKTLLDWYEQKIRCNHYCPMECHCADGIWEEYKEYSAESFEEEILERMGWYDQYH